MAQRDAQLVIPSRAKAKEPRLIDKNLYQERNKMEPLFNRWKHYRRIATRYDKNATACLAFIHLAAASILLL